jgi:secreted trypsin-like serine protease
LKWIGNRWEQVGIVSYGEMGCATKGYPAVFTRISYFHDWIESHIYSNNQTTISINKTNHRIAYGCSNYSVQCDCGRRKVLLSPSTIVKSENALPYSWSMIVSIRVGISSQHICSGTILESSYILTAAHCLANRSPQDITIKAGIHYRSDTNAIIRQVDHIYIHPNYTAQSNVYKHDIAILHLSQPLDTVNDAYIARTCRSLTSNQLIYETRYPSNGTQLVISGWDIINMSNASTSDSLQQAEVYAIEGNNANCFLSDDQRQLQFCAGRYGSDKGNI